MSTCIVQLSCIFELTVPIHMIFFSELKMNFHLSKGRFAWLTIVSLASCFSSDITSRLSHFANDGLGSFCSKLPTLIYIIT